MPVFVLVVLLALLVPYGVLAAAASMRFVHACRQPPPPAPARWPSVTALASLQASPLDAAAAFEASDYPADRLTLLRPQAEPRSPADLDGTGAVSEQRLPVDEGTRPASLLRRAMAAADGEVLVTVPAGGSPAAGSLRSMVRLCSADTPVVVGPTLIEHEDRFVPRLHALQHLGRLVATTGALHAGLPAVLEGDNRALHVATLRERPDAASRPATAFNPDADAAVACPPARSFGALVRRQARWLRRTWERGGLGRGQAAGLWGLHALLLACSLVAVAVPAWRQPTLLALLGKMGADVGLALPAAKHYGQRGLLRSLVPAELMLVLTLPMAGLRALFGPIHESASASSPGARRAERS